MAAASRKRISIPMNTNLKIQQVEEKGHFVVYTTDERQFALPLTYLQSEIFGELLRMAEEEFGLASNRPLTLPCDSALLEYAIFIIQRSVGIDEALLSSLSHCHSSLSDVHLQQVPTIKMARKWQKMAAASRKRISFPMNNNLKKAQQVKEKGHFVVYTTDGRRFALPLAYLQSEIFTELLRMAEEEFGLATDGPITLSCDSALLEYAISIIQRRVGRELEDALLVSLTRCHCSSSNSSLAAARADNFYYPPEWDPSQGSLNNFHGQHALRERARKLDQGILIIRFEMPYNIWCEGCESMIAKGVRFNAEKKQVGNYYSTKIWSFSMKSACCQHQIVIQTDPKNCEYVIMSGARKKVEEYDVDDAETMELPATEEKGKLADPFYRLEHQEEDMKKKKEAEPILVRLQRISDSRHSDDYSRNKALRAQLRSQRKRVAEEEAASRGKGLSIRLLPACEEDSKLASRMKFASKFDKNTKNKRALISSSSIFGGLSSSSDKKRMELESKRRKISAIAASNLLSGGFKSSSLTRIASSACKRRA
ncbi:hypothetical protein V2J09_005565 [Rumex salicifolius]